MCVLGRYLLGGFYKFGAPLKGVMGLPNILRSIVHIMLRIIQGFGIDVRQA